MSLKKIAELIFSIFVVVLFILIIFNLDAFIDFMVSLFGEKVMEVVIHTGFLFIPNILFIGMFLFAGAYFLVILAKKNKIT